MWWGRRVLYFFLGDCFTSDLAYILDLIIRMIFILIYEICFLKNINYILIFEKKFYLCFFQMELTNVISQHTTCQYVFFFF